MILPLPILCLAVLAGFLGLGLYLLILVTEYHEEHYGIVLFLLCLPLVILGTCVGRWEGYW